MEDRLHVDEYGYTTLLLVTVQQQARELAELRQRLEVLEHSRQPSPRPSPPAGRGR
jgi:hypothetical protein